MKLRTGFTLVELLVVIAIIGILTSVVIGSTTNSRSVARDDVRKSHLAQMQLALAQYYDVYRVYPSADDLENLETQKFLFALPTDPQTGDEYVYAPEVNLKGYCLGATLEGTVPDDSASGCSGSANYWVKR